MVKIKWTDNALEPPKSLYLKYFWLEEKRKKRTGGY